MAARPARPPTKEQKMLQHETKLAQAFWQGRFGPVRNFLVGLQCLQGLVNFLDQFASFFVRYPTQLAIPFAIIENHIK